MRPSNPQYTINSKGLTAKGIGDVFFRDPNWNPQDVPRFYHPPHHPHHVAVAEGEISNPKTPSNCAASDHRWNACSAGEREAPGVVDQIWGRQSLVKHRYLDPASDAATLIFSGFCNATSD